MGNEWITINKDVFDIGRYESLNVFRVFLYFLTHAAQKPRFDRGVRLECGQVIVTMDEVCEATGLTAREYRTAISKLVKDKQTTNERQTIDKRTTNKFSIITICNFDSYILMKKGERQTNDKQTTNERQTTHLPAKSTKKTAIYPKRKRKRKRKPFPHTPYKRKR